jgi:PAS domain S-box-containing protein
MNTTSVVLWSTDAQGLVVEDSPSWRRFTGREFESFKGMGWLDVIHPDDRARAMKAWTTAVETRTPYTIEYRVLRGDGQYVWTVARGAPVLDESGRVAEWVGANEDVSARKRAEEERAELLARIDAERAKLHSLIMQTPVAVAMLEGPDARYSLANDAFRELAWGQELRGRAMLDVQPDLRGHPLAEAVFETYRTGEPRTLVEQKTELADTDGRVEERYFTSSYRAVRDGERVTGVLVVALEVTDQVRARRAIESSMKFAEQFIGILGHDLRNPLSAIVIGASLLRKKTPTNGDSKTIDRILSSASRMTNMVAQLLDLTRSRLVGGIVVERQPVTLNEVVSNAVDELRQGHPTREIRCTMTPGVRGDWDPDRLEQVVSNVVGNALQHGDPTRPIDVRLAMREREAVLEVHNFGPPIPPEILPVLFDPYRHRDEQSARSQGLGLGLGLFISRQIVLAHGGRIDVTSNETEGTTVVVALPGPAEATRSSERRA